MFTQPDGTSSRTSDSDYGASIYTSDEDCAHSDGEARSTCSPPSDYQPGICPHCKTIFVQPLTLQCGHSLCALCCQQLLEKMSASGGTMRRNRIRMGLSSVSYSRMDKYSAQNRSSTSIRNFGVSWKSPTCPMCGERAKTTPPVPNLELANFLKTLTNLNLTEHLNPAYRGTSHFNRKRPSSIEDELSTDSPYRIRECHIAVVGAPGVGKTSMTHVQYGNDMLFGDLLGKRTSRNEEDLNRTFMIDILDDQDLESNIEKAHGFVLVYSITDRESFFKASELYRLILTKRGRSAPIVLVGSKCDSNKKRRVESYEGQGLARHIGCPFLEVSSKRNECVNEAFVELMRVVEKRKKL